MVVAGGVDRECSEEFSGGGIDDANVEVVDEEDDVGSGVGSSDADVAELAGDAEGDDAGGVDAVVSDSVVGVVGSGRGGFGSCVVDGGGSGASGE